MCKDGKKVFEQIIDIDNVDHISSLFGNFDENVRMVEQHYSVNVTSQSGNIKVCGEQANVISAARTLDGMLMLIKKGDALTAQNIEYVMSLVDNGEDQMIICSCDLGGVAQNLNKMVKERLEGKLPISTDKVILSLFFIYLPLIIRLLHPIRHREPCH